MKTPESDKSTNSGVYVVIVSGFEPLAFHQNVEKLTVRIDSRIKKNRILMSTKIRFN